MLKHFLAIAMTCLALSSACAANLPEFTRTEPERTFEPIVIQNGGFETSGGWVDGPGAPFTPTDDAHEGNRACRLNGGMVKTNLIPLEPGEEFHFEAYTKVDNLKIIVAELAFFDANRNWLRRGTGQLARGDQYSWQQIGGRYENTDPEVHYITLQFYGFGELDDVSAKRLSAAPPTEDKNLAKQELPLPEETTDDFIFAANDAFKVWFNRETGMVARLASLQPTEKVIQPTGANSMQLYMKSLDGKIHADFDRAVAIDTARENEFAFSLESSNLDIADLATAEIRYTLENDHLAVKAKITYKRDDFKAWQTGLRSVFRADEWKDTIFFSFPAVVRPTEATVRAMFFYDPDDIGVKNTNALYPCAVTEDDDRYFLWGSYDLGTFAMLTPNDISWRLPSMQQTPRMLKKGESTVFECNYAVFPKEDNELTQVLRHFIDHVHSSCPLMEPYVKRDSNPDRYFTEGAMSWYHPGAVPNGYDGWRIAMLERNSNNVWYSWWANWTEEALTDGDWITYDGRHLSAQGLKDEIAYMKSMGLNVYLYFRQFLAENGTYDDHAPYKSWLGRDAEGRRQPFIDFPVPNPDAIGGHKFVYWTCADFSNPQYRNWYLDMVKRAVDYYEPSGIAWDMGFGGAHGRFDPKVGLGNGTLWVQSQIWDWVKKEHPDMRVVSNECFYSPTALFADAILIEGAWDVAHKGPIDYQAAKAFDATLFSLQLVDDYVIQGAPEVNLTPFTHLRTRIRGENVRTAHLGVGDAVKAGFVPDGTWQTIDIPVTGKSTRMFGVSLQADDNGNAWLEMDGATLISKDNPAQETRPLWNEETSPLDFMLYEKWLHNKPTEAHCTMEGSALRFTALQPNGNAYWHCFQPIRGKLIGINLKVTALGAVCSDTQLPEMHELNEFAAKLAAMRHLSKKKLIYDAPQGVYGTFWQRNENVSGAIYNETGADCAMALRLKRAAFPDDGAALDNAAANGTLRIRIVAPDGAVTDANATLTPRDDDFLLEGTLPAASLLMMDEN